jgi:hypothetical protein
MMRRFESVSVSPPGNISLSLTPRPRSSAADENKAAFATRFQPAVALP